MVIGNGHSRTALVSTIVRRVGNTHICLFAIEDCFHILRLCCITTEETVSAEQPNIARFYEGFLFESLINVKIIILRFAVRSVAEQVSDFGFVKAGKAKVKTEILQFFHFHSEKLIVPAGIQCHAVISKNVRFLLCF